MIGRAERVGAGAGATVGVTALGVVRLTGWPGVVWVWTSAGAGVLGVGVGGKATRHTISTRKETPNASITRFSRSILMTSCSLGQGLGSRNHSRIPLCP